jgi:hypothetical protein
MWIAFAPTIIVGVAIFVTLRMSKHKWIIHALTFAALLFTMPVYIWIGGISERPGNGFVVLFYDLNSLAMAIGYAAYARLTRYRSRAVASLI